MALQSPAYQERVPGPMPRQDAFIKRSSAAILCVLLLVVSLEMFISPRWFWERPVHSTEEALDTLCRWRTASFPPNSYREQTKGWQVCVRHVIDLNGIWVIPLVSKTGTLEYKHAFVSVGANGSVGSGVSVCREPGPWTGCTVSPGDARSIRQAWAAERARQAVLTAASQ